MNTVKLIPSVQEAAVLKNALSLPSRTLGDRWVKMAVSPEDSASGRDTDRTAAVMVPQAATTAG